MKKLLLLVFALSLLPKGYAQDLLVTAKGDTVRCKILAKTDQQIFISVLQPDGTKISSYVSKDTIRTITPGYFVTESSPEKVTPLLTAPPMNQREKTKRSLHGVRFALSGGYSHRLGKLASGLKSSYKTGFVIGGDLAGFFNEYIGLGGFVNYRQYNDGSVSSVVVGPKILSRFYNRTQNSAFILGVGLGYVSYKESMSTIKATGGTFGTTLEIGYEIGLSKGVALMINASATAGSLGTIKVNGDKYDLDKRESMSSLNLAVGLVFGR